MPDPSGIAGANTTGGFNWGDLISGLFNTGAGIGSGLINAYKGTAAPTPIQNWAMGLTPQLTGQWGATNKAINNIQLSPYQQQLYNTMIPGILNQNQQGVKQNRNILGQVAGLNTDFYSGIPYDTSAQQMLWSTENMLDTIAQDKMAKALGGQYTGGIGTAEWIKGLTEPRIGLTNAVAQLEAKKAQDQQIGAARQTGNLMQIPALDTALTNNQLQNTIAAANALQYPNNLELQKISAMLGLTGQEVSPLLAAMKTPSSGQQAGNAISKGLGSLTEGPFSGILGNTLAKALGLGSPADMTSTLAKMGLDITKMSTDELSKLFGVNAESPQWVKDWVSGYANDPTSTDPFNYTDYGEFNDPFGNPYTYTDYTDFLDPGSWSYDDFGSPIDFGDYSDFFNDYNIDWGDWL